MYRLMSDVYSLFFEEVQYCTVSFTDDVVRSTFKSDEKYNAVLTSEGGFVACCTDVLLG